MRRIVSRGLRAVGDILLPRTCIVCGRTLLLDEKHLCLGCLSDLPETFFWQRSHNQMADRFNEIIEKRTGGDHERSAYAAALFFYHSEAAYRLIPYQIKYHDNLEAGRHFGKMLGRRLAGSETFADVDMVVPVPLHWARKWKRGYNQAEVIASAVAEAMGGPMRTDLLKRRRRTKTQTKMEVKDKVRNVSGAFAASERPGDIGGLRHLLLIDDVFTTGSTLYACRTALRTILAPSVRISVATLGYVGH